MDEVTRAVAAIAAGRMVIVTDDADRENEGDLVAAADAVTPDIVAFMATHGRGLICAPITPAAADRLDLPPMARRNSEAHGTAFTVAVDAAAGISTGISAADRARTIRLLADPGTGPADLARPGHVFPLVAHPRGVLGRTGHTEAGVDLAGMAGRAPAAVICEMLTPDGVPYRGEQLRTVAAAHGLPLVSVAQLVAYRSAGAGAGERSVAGPSVAGPSVAGPGVAGAVPASADGMPGGGVALPTGDDAMPAAAPGGGVLPPRTDRAPAGRVQREASATLPTSAGEFRALVFSDRAGTEHVALCLGLEAGDHFSGSADVLVRVHSECLTGEAFASLRCDCGPQLADALARIAEVGRGVVVYLRGHEGRGTGLSAKIRAYALQEQGRDTVQANLEQGLPVDARDYAAAGSILLDLGAGAVRLQSNNPAKAEALTRAGVLVRERVPAPAPIGADNLPYLRTKAERLGHLLPWLPTRTDPTPQETHR